MTAGRVSAGGFSLPIDPITPPALPATSLRTNASGWSVRDRVSQVVARAWEWGSDQLLVAGTTLKRRDHARWQGAETMQDLCNLTIGWLTGQLVSHPGYYGPVDVDEDDAPGLTQALVSLNRAGCWTCCSQAGIDREGYDGAHWTQLAAVEGFAEPAVVQELQAALDGTRYRIQAHSVREHSLEAVIVTRRQGQAYTGFGGSWDDEDTDTQTAGVGPHAVQAVRNSLRVLIWDPVVGANTLWADLEERGDQAL